MKHSLKKRWLSLGHLIPSIASVAIAATVVGFTLTAHAGKITSVPSSPSVPPNTPEFVADGFGGWNLDNVEIILTGTNSHFEESNGFYYFNPIDSDYTYQGHVDDGLGIGNVMGYVLAKDWPVGEPSGIKIVNDDDAVKAPKPKNCIMATSYLEEHFLDSTDPQQVLCSGPFQSHKRYKLAMLPTTVGGGAGSEQGIDLVFNVEPEVGSRDYQVFQKINNWTNGRLEGFTIQVGTGIGDEFVPAADGTSAVGVENLSLSVPEDIWAEDQLANFSAGLFGPIDDKHDRPAGFYDMETRAGFEILEYPNVSGLTDTLHSDVTLGSDYAEVPAGATDQFGPWLPSSMLPQGIFWDDDGNPATDAELLAWYGWNPNLSPNPGLGWMTGAADGFAEVEASTIVGWGEILEYTQGEIDDLVNVGLNYIVTIGDVTSFPGSTFTIRITPAVDTSEAGPPDYVGVTPIPSLVFTNPDGIVEISPSPEFIVGELLTLRVGDGDLVGSVDVEVTDSIVAPDCKTSGPTETVSLIEQGVGRGVFAATTDSFIDDAAGTVVTVIYTDADDGNGGTSVVKCASTVAVDEVVTPPASDLSITDFSAPASLFVGQTAKLSVTIKNAKEAEATASGTVTMEAEGFAPYIEAFELAPNKKLKVSNNWTVDAEGTVVWTATVEFTAGQSGSLTDSAETVVTLKPGKNNNNGNNNP